MRINSCPVAHPCFLCHFFKSSSFISNAPTPMLPLAPRSLVFLLYIAPVSQMLWISPESSLSSTHTPLLSIAILPLLLKLSSSDRGASQPRWLSISGKSLYHVCCGGGEGGSVAERLQRGRPGVAATFSYAYTLDHAQTRQGIHANNMLLFQLHLISSFHPKDRTHTHTVQHYIPKLLVPDSILYSVLSVSPPAPSPISTQYTISHTTLRARHAARHNAPL